MSQWVESLLEGDAGGAIKVCIAISILALGVGGGIGLAAVGIGVSSRMMYGESPSIIRESKVCETCGAHPR